ncbi:hypothetical protein SEA_KILKOR_12 [Mycobacterium phage KilKor]|uniref:Uncharacterized protein n=1 Tax=Mycobacterium phage KilKor TaxID=2696373 RepID=A0A6B9T1X3_9CAUD|nr:minor tail protein [Mycobacterium phage Megiddo]YP_010001313.1 minor tail protein [Mycobacterium phage KilKor]QHB41279.1 hypothetical protein SEA_PHALM_12 [Mycobacterium phage Phalm]QHB41436.1 hypothetical protein SEA_GLASKE_12 [Mycobacterium phage Glaske]QHJ86270.1 hypothetical protein SEA_CACTUSJACK_12 [Mycobacterium phage CactusJack]QIG57605.1 hypothetical protein SEA_STRESSBALL_12 [Mycobacterium phage StressBall]QHB41358.1 hypothetical protein SEA_MEGIDDO_12 [Mycobacterium phage Megidd
MARRRSRTRVSSRRDIERELREKISRDATLDTENEALAEEIKGFIQSQTPIDEADAVASIKVRKVKKPRNKLPARTIYSDSPLFHMIEHGTMADPAGTKDPRRVEVDDDKWATLGPDTPTKAYAPFGKAKARYGDRL